MNLFSERDTREYFDSISKELKYEVSKITDDDIINCDFDEWIDYLYNKYEITPITLYEENTEKYIEEVKVKKRNPFFLEGTFEQEFYFIDGVKITYRIPYDGNTNLLYLKPNKFILMKFKVEFIKNPCQNECGAIELAFEYDKKELQNKYEQMQMFVHNNFENKFRNYRAMIENVNEEVTFYNNNLKSFAEKCLEERKNKASSFAFISHALEIPLLKSKNAPNSIPIKLERVKREPVKIPNKKAALSEYCISDNDYENINNIIYMCGTTMEKTSRTYFRNNEEELRDHLLATLNTHYENATGETFRKIGKTDIHIEFDNKAAFIGECKIWRGNKAFEDAIQQILNYSTWKDIKLSVIIFNKKNQSFLQIVEKINTWVEINTKSYSRKTQNTWNCKFYRPDMNIEIKINILVFDLYVDETKFQDSRN